MPFVIDMQYLIGLNLVAIASARGFPVRLLLLVSLLSSQAKGEERALAPSYTFVPSSVCTLYSPLNCNTQMDWVRIPLYLVNTEMDSSGFCYGPNTDLKWLPLAYSQRAQDAGCQPGEGADRCITPPTVFQSPASRSENMIDHGLRQGHRKASCLVLFS